MKFSKLSLCIGAVLGLSGGNLAAQEAESSSVERIEVTGSRIKRVDMEGATPVTILDSQYLESTGFTTVGEVLRNSSFNSFGSWGGGSNNSWGSQSTISLKGSGAFHTLILLDGQRMAKSPVLNGGAANLNTIPRAAVERIEILTDGASAIYGTDAIAGVVNIILKKDFEGAEVSVRAERPEAEGGDANSYTLTGGLDSKKGNMIFTWEHYEQDAIFDRMRDWTRLGVMEGGDPAFIDDWVGMSPTGRTLIRSGSTWDYLNPITNADCDAYNINGKQEFYGPLQDRTYPNDRICGYDYTLEAAMSTQSRRDNMLVNYSYQLAQDIKLLARGYWAKNETLETSAPTPANIIFDKDLPSYTTAEGYDLAHVETGDRMAFRFNTLGNRTTKSSDDILDILVALEGATEIFDWNASYTYSRYNNFAWGQNYILNSALTDAVGDWDEDEQRFEGWDPRDPHSSVPPGVRANFDKRNEAVYEELNLGATFNLFELSGGEVGLHIGASYREEEFSSEIDGQAAAGNVFGGNGGAGGIADREVYAGYFELLLPVLDELEVNLAARYDDYSDFGSTFNPQLSIRYNLTSDLLLRASWGEGFRAPTLQDLYQGQQEGWGDQKNWIRCYQDGTSLAECTLEEHTVTYTGGNQDLQPEESESINLGLVWQINDTYFVRLDYWQLELKNLIDDMEGEEVLLRQVFLWQDQGESTYIGDVISGLGYKIGPSGRLESITALTGNFGESDRAGYDLQLGAEYETGIGEFKATLDWSHYVKYTYSYLDPASGEVLTSEDKAGQVEYPDDKLNLTLNWEWGDHNVNLLATYIDKQQDVAGSDRLDSYTTLNLSYSLQLPWEGKLAIGALNLLDEEVPLDQSNETRRELYDIRGRTLWLSYTQSFN